MKIRPENITIEKKPFVKKKRLNKKIEIENNLKKFDREPENKSNIIFLI